MLFETAVLAKALLYFHFTSSDTLTLTYPVLPPSLFPSLNIASALIPSGGKNCCVKTNAGFIC